MSTSGGRKRTLTRGPYEENAMKGGSKLFIFTGVALALVTVLLAITMTSEPKTSDAQDDPDKVRVVRAAADFEPHTVISMADIVVEELPADQVPADAATDTRLVLGMSYGLGATKGDVLLNSYLEPPGITASIAPGKRAFSLALDEREMMSGLIMDGDYVDVVFDARIDLNRIIGIYGLELHEDQEYELKDLAEALGSIVEESQGEEDGTTPGEEGTDQESEASNVDIAAIQALLEEIFTSPAYQGNPNSQFTITDFGEQLEPVTKILVQDVKVIRVVKPTVSYDAQGQQVQQDPAQTNDDLPFNRGVGQLILEVTPQQAEALSFMQQWDEDQYKYHDVEVIVRGKDDHEIANTTGITFDILITDETWGLPYPKPIVRPEEADT
jgi:hypothetical protein